MKRKRKDSEYSHYVFIPILLLNFLVYGVVSGLDLPQAGGEKKTQSGLSNLSYPSLSAQGKSDYNTFTSNEENVTRTDDFHRNAQSNDVSTLQSIQNLYHKAFLLLKNVLKSENRTDTVSSKNFDFQNTINREHENNKTLSGRKNNVLGKSPLPPFKTRQNNSTFLGNKTSLPRKITYSKKIYQKNDSTGKLWENLRTPLNFFGKFKLQENRTGLTQLGNHSKSNRKMFNEKFLRNDTNQSILRSTATNRKYSLSKNSTSHDSMKQHSVNNINLSLSSNNDTRHSDRMYSYAGLTRNTTNHNEKINSRLSRNSTKHDHVKHHTVNGLGNDLAKIETFSKLGTLSSTLNLSMFDSENIFNNSLHNVTGRHSNQTLEHSSLLDNGSFVNSLNNSGIYLRTKDQNQTRNRSVGETSSWIKSLINLETNSSQSLSSLGNLLITQDIIMQLGEKKDRSPRVKDKLTCSTGDVQHNSTLSAGLNAGYFTEEGKVKTMDDCIYHCCAKRKCNVAFMIKESCFLVQCHDKSSCRSRKAQSSSFMPRLAFTFRQDQQADDILSVNKETIQSKTKEHCNYHKVTQNVTFRSGLEAGLFTPHGEVTSFQECVHYCCQEEHCDVAFMEHNLCYSVHCKNQHSCAPTEGLGYKTTTSLGFIARGNNQPLVDVSDFKIEHQKHLEEAKHMEQVPSSCSANDVVSPVLKNVKLRDGLNAGNFTDKGKVSDYHQCVSYCCKDKRCNVALTLKNNCFLVTCKTYSGCLTYQTLKTDFDPQVVYINWTTPTDKVLTKGSILYKMLGCWQEDERLENIVSLEGTDPILTDSYKLRKNAVERCAVAARKRNFNVFILHNGGECRSGVGIEDVFKTKGKSNGCPNGGGGPSSNHVYYLKRNGSIGNYGCWNAIQNDDGFVTLESTDGRIMGDYKNRYDAFFKCAETAMEQHYTLFALRDGGQCFGGLKAATKYKKHGVSRHCKNGLGSGSSKSVYQIIGSTTFKLNHNDGSFLELSRKSKEHQLHHHEMNPKVFLFTVTNKKTNFRGKKIKVINWQDKAVKKQTNISYKAGPVTRNIFIHGMNAGNFTGQGAVRNMAECIQYCGKQLNCSVAFMVLNYCFSIKCFTQESCATKSAASTIFHPKVSFISHFSPRNLQPGATSSKQCQTNKIYENVTLFGGINSGNFTDLGWRKNMNECIRQCCQRQRCDVAFMLGSDCYGVTCKTKQLCGTKPAKHVEKYRPRIAYIQSPQDEEKEETLSSCWSGEVLENHTLTGGIDAGVFYSNGNTETMISCMKYCCQQKDCDLAFRIDQGCYTVRCKDKKQCRPRKARETHYRPQIAYKKHTTFIHHDSRGKKYEDGANDTDTDPFKNKLVNTSKNESTKSNFNNGKTKPVIKPARLPHSCEVGGIHYNVTLKMGMHSGVFNKLGRAKTMEDCIEMCCHEKESNAAFMLGKLCYSVKCYNSDLCQTRPAFISSINKLNINPAVAFLNTATKQHSDYSRSEIERRCVGTTVKENFTLLGGSSAGTFIDNGERGTMEECISACCNTPSCDVAFMNGKRCYSVRCSNKTLCQAVRAEPTLNKPVVAYVARYLDSDTQDLQLSAATSQCPLESINKFEVFKNKSLIGGFESGNYTFLGRTTDMITCIQQCCGLGKCDVAYSIDGNCYGIECFSKNLCSVDDRTPDSTSTEISIIKNLSDGESRFYSRYVFPGFSAILVVIIIIGWLYWIRSKKILSRLK